MFCDANLIRGAGRYSRDVLQMAGKFILLALMVGILSGAISAKTPLHFEVGTNGSLPCNITGVTAAAWEDDDEERPIFIVFETSELPSKTSYAGGTPKYNRYSVDFERGSKFDLLVDPIQLIDDAGNYDCEDIESGVIVSYSMNVEVSSVVSFTCLPPCTVDDDMVTITENSTCTCTCVAAGGYPGTLRLEWNDVGVMGQQQRSFNTSDPDGSYDFRRDITLEPFRNDTLISCSIVGYKVSAIQNSADIEASMTLEVQYRPECTLVSEFPDGGDCTMLTLNCSCDAVPAVAEGDYWFYRNGSLINGTGSTRTVVVGLDEPTEFSCNANNTVGDGDLAITDQEYLCRPSCTSSSCQNGGTCNPLGPRVGYNCTCMEFYLGDDCGIVTACAASPCKNSGICQYNSTGDDYSCDCHGSYSGPNCTILPPGPSSTVLYIIIGAGIAVVIIIVIFLFCCWYCNREGSKDPGSGNGTLVSYQDHNATCNPAYTEDFGAPNNGNVVVADQVIEVKSRKSRNVADDSVDPSALYGKIDKSRKSKKTTEGPRDPHVPSPEKPGPRGDANRRPTETKPEEPSEAAPKSKAAAADVELQYADLDHGRAPPSKKVHQPQDEPTAYAEVNFRLVEV